jgi:hypothetical protein
MMSMPEAMPVRNAQAMGELLGQTAGRSIFGHA